MLRVYVDPHYEGKQVIVAYELFTPITVALPWLQKRKMPQQGA